MRCSSYLVWIRGFWQHGPYPTNHPATACVNPHIARDQPCDGGATMWYYGTFTLGTDYAHYALARAYQGLGYGFFFVPVNVLAYSQLRPDQNNRASSLTNLFRNWGGSFGIAFITTAAERRHQFHQLNLGSAIGATSQQLTSRVTELTNYLVTKGFSS